MTMQDFLVVGGGTVMLLAIFLVAGYFMRGGTLDIWGIVRHYVAVRMLPPDGAEDDGIGIEPPVPGVVLSALEAEHTGTSIPVREITTRGDVLDILARVKADGKYLFTGNKLADLFTGTVYAASRNTILDEIAAIRNPDKIAVAHRPGAPLKRPVNGWN
jgi:hypothetical protein